MHLLFLIGFVSLAVLSVLYASSNSYSSLEHRSLLSAEDVDEVYAVEEVEDVLATAKKTKKACVPASVESGWGSFVSSQEKVTAVLKKVAALRKKIEKEKNAKAKASLKKQKSKLQDKVDRLGKITDAMRLDSLKTSLSGLVADASCYVSLVGSIRTKLADATCTTIDCIKAIPTELKPATGESCAVGISSKGKFKEVIGFDGDSTEQGCPDATVTQGLGDLAISSEDVDKYTAKKLKYKAQLKAEKDQKKKKVIQKKLDDAKAQLEEALAALAADPTAVAELKTSLRASSDDLINKWSCLKGLVEDASKCITAAASVVDARKCTFVKSFAGANNEQLTCEIGLNGDGGVGYVE